jgi:hypothetical protein
MAEEFFRNQGSPQVSIKDLHKNAKLYAEEYKEDIKQMEKDEAAAKAVAAKAAAAKAAAAKSGWWFGRGSGSTRRGRKSKSRRSKSKRSKKSKKSKRTRRGKTRR